MTDYSVTVKCSECGRLVELHRVKRQLALSCDCPERRFVRVRRAIPDGWTD